MPKKISAVGISARNMETKQVPSITLSRTNFALLPNIGRTYRERRLAKADLGEDLANDHGAQQEEHAGAGKTRTGS